MAPRILSPEDDQARVLRRPPPRRLRTAKPEEGTGEGELLHVLRALALVVLGTLAFGWLIS
ncbi:hypothetical protein QWZ14_13185 [Paeniroseomonas aquatica]|uniref:Uncharacterized protein n=1 Tax=Paeniroseomonas aquatica TaxID=373043 RepID=A0ABT8A6V4_9PROT|nr:hypothetical protein [Paeniroseomonas aquatica]MDN3565319.1 hypothetical protein [Paeniroseomonas aquatica]